MKIDVLLTGLAAAILVGSRVRLAQLIWRDRRLAMLSSQANRREGVE